MERKHVKNVRKFRFLAYCNSIGKKDFSSTFLVFHVKKKQTFYFKYLEYKINISNSISMHFAYLKPISYHNC